MVGMIFFITIIKSIFPQRFSLNAITNCTLVCRNRWKQNGVAGGSARADTAGEQYVEQQLLRVQSLSQMRAALASWWTLAFRNGKRERRVLVQCSLFTRAALNMCEIAYDVPDREQFVYSSAFAFELDAAEQSDSASHWPLKLIHSNSND